MKRLTGFFVSVEHEDTNFSFSATCGRCGCGYKAVIAHANVSTATAASASFLDDLMEHSRQCFVGGPQK